MDGVVRDYERLVNQLSIPTRAIAKSSFHSAGTLSPPPAKGLHPLNPYFWTQSVRNNKFLFTFFKK